MRYFIITILLIANCLFAKSQVGINTNTPKGVFNISTNGSTSSNGNLIMRVNSNGEANLILGNVDETLTENVSLFLNDPNKGLLLNNVSLKSIDDTETVPDPTNGMLVYNNNISDSSVSSLLSVSPGLYFNQDKFWRRLFTVVGSINTNTTAYIRDLGTISSASAIGTGNTYQPTTYITNIDTGAGAVSLYTRTPSSGNTEKGTSSFEIPESGNYVFIFRWYGHPYSRSTNIITDYNYYAYLFKTGETTPLCYTLVKPWLTSNFSTSFSIMTPPTLEKGDMIEIRIGQETLGTAAEWRLISHANTSANRTSLVFFKYK